MDINRRAMPDSEQTFVPAPAQEHHAYHSVKAKSPFPVSVLSYPHHEVPPLALLPEPSQYTPTIVQRWIQGTHGIPQDYETVPPRYPGMPAIFPPSVSTPPREAPSSSKEAVCGIRRKLCFLSLLTFGGLVLLAIALGVGLGVGLGSQNRASTLSAADAAASSPSSVSTEETRTATVFNTGTATRAPSQTSSVSTSTSQVTSSKLTCPGAQNAQLPTSNGKQFIHLCGIDYGGVEQAVDIGNVRTSSFQDCIEKCSVFVGCMGVGWGIQNGDDPDEHTCWMKANLTTWHNAITTWNFGVLLAGPAESTAKTKQEA
ncbi:hypothetical protein B0T26DRAFT_34279 [Lasiosphaeria miniovina]|uniref:Apple domain-containing protein n=1 Tax=Lasiosphaeria miniovina TaxID=1954250 RepID=A0AA40BGB5_9PEZI|nr:uncharacterized protein B0T26DRAFT_34279 [Lasiosphaeria miniovina]KAK0733727.1 hypothetical protein B0T26DRAFT_34279 [Lasiosphaeria miniovina]